MCVALSNSLLFFIGPSAVEDLFVEWDNPVFEPVDKVRNTNLLCPKLGRLEGHIFFLVICPSTHPLSVH